MLLFASWLVAVLLLVGAFRQQAVTMDHSMADSSTYLKTARIYGVYSHSWQRCSDKAECALLWQTSYWMSSSD